MRSRVDACKVQQEDDDNDGQHDDNQHVQELLYLGVHRNEGVNSPQANTGDNENDDKRNERHGNLLLRYRRFYIIHWGKQ